MLYCFTNKVVLEENITCLHDFLLLFEMGILRIYQWLLEVKMII